MGKVIGIDFGTTFSVIAHVNEHGQPEIIPNLESERITPSVILFEDNLVPVGKIAKQSARAVPEQIVEFVKREMGKSKVKQFKFKSVPDRTTLSRRYKQLAPRIEQFITYLGDLGVSLDTQTPRDVVYEDKSLSKAQGSVWHQKDRKANHIPEGLRALDTDASWLTSKYCGWVYGYGLHLTTTALNVSLINI